MSDTEVAPVVRTKNGRQGEGGGQPRKKIDYEMVEKLALLQCTQQEIASFLDMSVDTLYRNKKFCGLYKRSVDKGRMSLRRHQWRALEEGNTTMLVWLGKQYLGQRDKFEHSGNVDLNVNNVLEDMRERARQQRYQLIENSGEIVEGEDAS